jgi:16S rRNA (adenine1518-N6/adenine1519-N6)-dimethyltransferase
MEHRARKRFGQNFLVDERVVDRILTAIAPMAGQRILEIGPGHAALTTGLALSGALLQLIEIDRDLAASLQSRFDGVGNVQVHCADALRLDLPRLTSGQPFRLVGNLPYNISTPILFHVLQWQGLVVDMHFMLQQELVERMAANPGGKAWGRLSVMCQFRCSVTPLFNVPPEAFRPQPAVQSTFVRLVPHAEPPVRVADLGCFERIITRAFSMRRKTLRNSLRGLLDAAAIAAAGIDPGIRPERLGLAEFAALADQLSEIHDSDKGIS